MENLDRVFEQNKGYLVSDKIRGKRNLYYQLKAMLETGSVVQVRRGLYRHTRFAEEGGWGQTCMVVPQGVVCLFSAWYFHQLSTHIPSVIHLALPAKKKMVLPDFPPIKLYYWDVDFYRLGVTKTTYNGEDITIYDLEKSVCDAIRYRNKVGMDVCVEVLRSYLKRKDRNLDRLMKYANILRVSKILNQYINLIS